MLRGRDLHPRSLAYETNEILLLHPAIKISFKSKYRNTKQILNSNFQNSKHSGFEILVIGICLGFRISCFGFQNFIILRICRSSPENGVASQSFTAESASSSETNRAPKDKTLALLCSRESFTISSGP